MSLLNRRTAGSLTSPSLVTTEEVLSAPLQAGELFLSVEHTGARGDRAHGCRAEGPVLGKVHQPFIMTDSPSDLRLTPVSCGCLQFGWCCCGWGSSAPPTPGAAAWPSPNGSQCLRRLTQWPGDGCFWGASRSILWGHFLQNHFWIESGLKFSIGTFSHNLTQTTKNACVSS